MMSSRHQWLNIPSQQEDHGKAPTTFKASFAETEDSARFMEE
jgi:hypothetical protein